MRKLISYPIDKNAPGWPGNPSYEAQNYSSIEKGDSANTYILHLFNHFGTHMDAPNHFNDKGARMHTFPIDTFIYERPLLLDIPKGAGEKVTPADLIPYADRIAASDLLLIRTGFEPMRAEDPKLYSENGPAVSCEAAKDLMEHFAGKLKALAMDFISLASPADPADGNEAHRWMCGCYSEGNIFIIEDVKMSEILADKLQSAAAVPLFLTEVDSSPVTMWVEEEE